MEGTTSLLPAVRFNHRELHVWVARSHGELVGGLRQSQDDLVRMISSTVPIHFVLFIVLGLLLHILRGGVGGGSAMQMISNCLAIKRTTMAEVRYAPINGNGSASHGPAQQTRP